MDNVGEDTIHISGLGSMVTSPLLVCYGCVVAGLSLVVGEAATLLNLSLVVVSVGLLQAVMTLTNNPTLASVLRPRWLLPCLLAALSPLSFYATSHTQQFSSLPWLAAFVGGTPHGVVIPGKSKFGY